MATVTWVFDGTNYEVSSKEHLLQVMNKGATSGLTDSGTFPTDYWGATTKYIQTADIDLAFDANISPIGTSATSDEFYGEYDGNFFNISNWEYTAGVINDYMGLFGISRNGVLQRIRLTGVWKIDDFTQRAGFLSSWARSVEIYDIEGNFDEGTYINGGSTKNGGTFSGYFQSCTIEGITLRGNVSFSSATTGSRGGISAFSLGSSIAFVRNFAYFPLGIVNTTGNVGGIFGSSTVDTSMTYILNAMSGDIHGGRAGGILGVYNNKGTVDAIVNAMTGNITSPTNAGGFCGELNAFGGNVAYTRIMNYMNGNITSTTASIFMGGMFGSITDNGTWTVSVTNSIVAMNGTVEFAFKGVDTSDGLTVECLIDTSFGMTYNTLDEGSLSQTLTGYTYDPEFTDLPYVPLEGLVLGTTTYEWEMVFANVGGKPAYSDYTHIVLFKHNIYSPGYVEFDSLESNTTIYVGYYNSECSELYVNNASLVVNDSDIAVIYEIPTGGILFGTPVIKFDSTPGSVYISFTWPATDVYYQIEITDPELNKTTVVTGTEELSANAGNLIPETEYTVEFYSSPDDVTYTLLTTESVTTLENTIANFDQSIFFDGIDVYNLSLFDSSTLSVLEELFDDIFTTADKLKLVDNTGTTYETSFINVGATVDISDSSAFYLPFAGTDPGQGVTITTSDPTPTTISYNETTGSITVVINGGTPITYTSGQSFKLDGKTVYVSS